MFQIECPIPQSEFDQTYQHLHHAGFFKLIEQGRLKFLEALGMPNQYFIDRGELIVIVATEAKFLREIRGPIVNVTVNSFEVVDKSLVLVQSIYNERNKRAFDASVTLMFMSATTRRAIPVPQDLIIKSKSYLAELDINKDNH